LESKWSSATRVGLTILAFALVFCLLQNLTFTLRFPPFERTTIWTPGSLLFTALLLTPPRRWWVYYLGLCLGVFAAYYGDTAIPVARAMLMAQFHFGAVALGAWGIRRFSINPRFENLTSLVVFFAFAAVLVPVMTSAPGDLLRFASGADDVWPVALRSVLCVALGMLIATPALTLTLSNGIAWLRAGAWPRFIEFASVGGALAVAGFFCFDGQTGTTASPALLYSPLPLLVWAAVRFELAGVSWALLLLAFQSTWANAGKSKAAPRRTTLDDYSWCVVEGGPSCLSFLHRATRHAAALAFHAAPCAFTARGQLPIVAGIQRISYAGDFHLDDAGDAENRQSRDLRAWEYALLRIALRSQLDAELCPQSGDPAHGRFDLETTFRRFNRIGSPPTPPVLAPYSSFSVGASRCASCGPKPPDKSL